MSTWSFNKADNIEDTVDEIIKQLGWIMSKLDSKNVKRLDTNETVIKSASGKTYIHGPVLEMDDTNRRRLNMGLNESTNEFMFELYNEAGAKTVSIDSDGKGVFNQVTLRNDLVGSAYVQINTSGLIAYNGSVKTIEVGSDGNSTFKQVTLRNDLTGAAYVQINTSGLVAYNGTVNTVEINTNGNATFKQVTLRNDLTGSNYINIDTSGIYAWDNALLLKSFEINSSGKAYFRGDITSDATITGATIRSGAVGADRIELSSGKFRGITAAGDVTGLYFDIGTISGTGIADLFLYHNGTKLLEFYDNVTSYSIKGASTSTGLILGGTSATTYTEGSWDFNSATILNLVTDSAGSHSHGSATGSYGGHDHGIPNGTVLMVDGGGTVTFSSVSDHWHSISSDGSHSHNVQ